MIKNVIFDLGNVLLSFQPQEYLRTKIRDENKVQQIYEAIFLSEEWIMLDRGTITQDDAVERIIARNVDHRELIQCCMENWLELLTPMEETVAILKEIKSQGYKTFILSNFHAISYENVSKRYSFFNYFDGELISCREKLLKPEVEIYQMLAERYNIEPQESLFIDDTKLNIEGAEGVGFAALLFENAGDLRNKLIQLKILENN